MTLDQYHVEWLQDARLPADTLDESARNVPYLHAKWWRFYAEERLKYKKIDLEYKVLYKHKVEWYSGKMLDEDRLDLKWPVNPRKILPAQLTTYIDADADIQTLQRSRILSEETLRFLEDVIKQINGRGFHIKNTIDFLKFKNGLL
jgi:hypothetical protein